MQSNKFPDVTNAMQENIQYLTSNKEQGVGLLNSTGHNEKEWDSSIFECISCERPGVCLLACVCPFLVFGEIYDGFNDDITPKKKTIGARCNLAACGYCLLDYPFLNVCALFCTYAMGISVPWLPSLSFCIHHGIRTQIRQKDPQNPIRGSSCDDICITCLVPCCALIQEHKQVFPTPSD